MSDIIDGDTLGSDSSGNKPLPNATACLVLGIISIVTFWLYGVPGIVCGIIAIALHSKDKRIYSEDPKSYKNAYKSSRAGMILGLIGLILSVLFLVFIVVAVLVVASELTSFR